MSESNAAVTQPEAPKSRGRRWLWLGLAAALLGGTILGGRALVGTSMAAAAAWHGGGGHGPFGLWRGRAVHDPEQARRHAEFAVRWVLRSVGATDAQQQQVQSIVGGLIDEIHGLAPVHQENRQAFLDELSRPTIDRAALDRLRSAELDLFDQTSLKVVEAFAEIAEVLTPEQRRELMEAVQEFHH
jgi:Spy/CpxP family protein refolding chaperone